MQSEFADAGAQTVLAATVDEALAALRPEITAAILDMGLNGESVRPVAQKLAELGIPFIFHSGKEESTTARGWSHAPIVIKPAAPGQVAEMLLRMIAAHAASAASTD